MIAAIAAVLQAIAIIVTAYFASRGLNAWRRQLVGKRRLEVAEDMLLAAYKAASNLRHVRNPLNFGEGRSRERDPGERPGMASSKDMYFVPLERLRGLSDELAQVSKVRFLAAVHFGQEAVLPFDAIHKAYHEVAVAARMLVTTVGELAPSDTAKALWEKTIWNGGAEDDPITTVVTKAVRDLEAFCRPHLTEGGK
jgi:hypothetical protein